MSPSSQSSGNHQPNGGFPSMVEVNGYHPCDSPLKILIVGAGLGGLAAAISCSLAGHQAVVLEAASALSEVGAGIQLSPNVTRLLRRWGLFPTLQPLSVQPGNIYFRRWQTGEPIGLTKLVPDFEQEFGAPYWVVHRAHLHRALLDRAVELGTVVHVNSRVVSIDLENALLTTKDGKLYEADLILGCDGLKSVTRENFLGGHDPGPAMSPYCAYRATVPMELLEADPELAVLVEKADLSVWIGDQRHVMSYPINGGKTFNMVLSHPDERVEGEGPMDQESILHEMRENYRGWDPKLTKIISLITQTAKWKLMTYPRLPSWRHPSGKYVLMGDASHGMLPYMSQGAAQAIEDAAALGRCMARYTGSGSLGALTMAYEAIRMDRAYEVQDRSALNGRIWHYADGEDQRFRDAGMAASLSTEHYIRSTNQWSDPATQLWLYNHDAERVSDEYLDRKLGPKGAKGNNAEGTRSGVQEMIDNGLLAPLG